MGRKKMNRSEHKTLRLTEEAKFSVTILAQKKGQSGNAFVEAAVHHYAEVMALELKIPLSKIWHINESIRTLRWFALGDKEFKFDDEQARQRDFVHRHRVFFYEMEDGAARVLEDNAIELFPKLAEFMAVTGDHWAAGKAMAEYLDRRGLTPPEWPPVNR